MSRKLWSSTVGLVLLVAACGGSQPPASERVSVSFVPQNVDFLDDVGYSPSLAVDEDGNPYISYLGFTHVQTKEEKKEGVIPPARPVTAPRLPAVLVASQLRGIWNRGAAVQSSDQATGPKVPIGRSDETATAVDPNGVQHVVWTQKNGLFYSNNEDGEFPDEGTKVAGADATGPSIAIDSSGTPWVAFYKGRSVEAATVSGTKVRVERVDSATNCSSCPPARTAIQAGSKGPMIAYGDAGMPMLATRSGKGWSTQPLAKAGGIGISLAVDSSGTAHVSFLDGDGFVTVATFSGGVALARVGRVSVGNPAKDLAGGTAIAVAKDGTQYVAWADSARGVRLAQASGGSFSPVPTEGTEGGTSPSLAATPDGSVTLAWFRATTQDLMVGTYPEHEEGLLAQPSPSATPAAPSPPGGAQGCAPSDVDITAPPGAAGSGFQQTEVSAPAKPFQICFNNEDSTQHNVAIFKSESEATGGGKALFAGEIVQGPTRVEYKVGALQGGSYFFRCDVHPTTMTGTLTVK
jgi:hypothetical protein